MGRGARHGLGGAVSGASVFGPRQRTPSSAQEQAGRARDVVFITHELTEDTRRALIDGTIDIIINQDAGHEVRSAIRVLMSKADRLPIVEQMERIRIDIYLRDNIP